MKPRLIKGSCFSDVRGNLKYNNDFNASNIKRMYIIENESIQLKRGWQGHKIEQRWFSVVSGNFEILLIKKENWNNSNIKPERVALSSETLDILHIPAGYLTCIQAKEENAKLLVMSNYLLGAIDDEYKFALDDFECTKDNMII